MTWGKRSVAISVFSAILTCSSSPGAEPHAEAPPDRPVSSGGAMTSASARRLLAALKDTLAAKQEPTESLWRKLEELLGTMAPCLLPVQREARALIETFPDDIKATYRLHAAPKAKVLLAEAKKKTDPRLLLEVVLRYPSLEETAEAAGLLGTHALDRGKSAEAALYLSEALRLRPRDAKLWLAKAVAAKALGRDDELKKALATIDERGGVEVGGVRLTGKPLEAELARAPVGASAPSWEAALSSPYPTSVEPVHLLALREPERLARLAPPRVYSAIAAGHRHTCAIVDGKPVCWGFDGNGRATPPVDLGKVTALSTGLAHTCAIADGKPVCWGHDGDGRTTPPAGLGKVTAITGGGQHTCAIADEKPVCWGLDDVKQATPPAGLDKVTAITAGNRHTCAIADGKPVCWGRNDHAQATPPAGLRRVTAIVAGYDHTCAIAGGAPVCWGSDSYRQATPRALLGKITGLSAGGFHTCAIVDGKPVCWGNSRQTTPPSGLGNVTALSAGTYHTCAITDGKPVCWGGTENTSPPPPLPPLLQDLADCAATEPKR